MAKKHKSKINKMTKYAGFVVIAAILIIMYFGTGGTTAKFYASMSSPTKSSTSSSLGAPTQSVGAVGTSSGNALSSQPTCSPGKSRSCYTGASGTENVGVCKAGTQTCGPDRKWSACTGEVKPSAEVCNDVKDNDCDGLIDCKDGNCATSTYCPDLTPTNLLFTYPAKNMDAMEIPSFVVTIKNIGKGTASNVDVAVYDKDGFINSCSNAYGKGITSITVGSEATCNVPVAYNKYNVNNLPTYIKAVVDQDNKISELDETNNVLETNNIKTQQSA